MGESSRDAHKSACILATDTIDLAISDLAHLKSRVEDALTDTICATGESPTLCASNAREFLASVINVAIPEISRYLDNAKTELEAYGRLL